MEEFLSTSTSSVLFYWNGSIKLYERRRGLQSTCRCYAGCWGTAKADGEISFYGYCICFIPSQPQFSLAHSIKVEDELQAVSNQQLCHASCRSLVNQHHDSRTTRIAFLLTIHDYSRVAEKFEQAGGKTVMDHCTLLKA